MSHPQLPAEARAVWVEIAAAEVEFPKQGIDVVVSLASRLCPPGWAGLVLLADSGIGTAPDQSAAETIRELLAGYHPRQLSDPAEVERILPAAAMLGPATLAYLAPESFRPAAAPVAEQLPVEHPDLRVLESLCSPDERGEAGIDELTSPVFAIREGGHVVAAAGYVAWPRNTAHMAVLTAPGARGRGLAKAAASSAVAYALAARMLPQWRARVPASQRVARALGFTDLGVQISLRLA